MLHHCPDGRDAMFVLTDHGDRPQLDVLTAIYSGCSPDVTPCDRKGILGHGVKITQGFFWSGYPGYQYLDNPACLALMRRVDAAGSEICPHNTSENVLPPDETRADLLRFSQEFGLTTFIDHGHMPSNLSQRGSDPDSDHYILDELKAAGVLGVWSFRDATANPPDGLIDMMQPPSTARFVGASMRPRRLTGRDAYSTRAAVTGAVNSFIGPSAAYSLLRALTGRPPGSSRVESLRSSWRAFRSFRRNRSEQAGAFPFRYRSDWGLMEFDSVRVNLISAVYNETALDQLIAGCGVHVGHTYLGLTEGRHRDLCVEKVAGGWRTRSSFEEFLGHLAQRKEARLIWNPTMREALRFLTGISRCALLIERSTVLLENRGEGAAAGVTVRSQERLEWSGPVTEIKKHGEWWYVTDLDAGESIHAILS